MRRFYPYVLLSVALAFTACHSNSREEQYELVNAWVGKEITFPEKMVFIDYKGDTVDLDYRNQPKILVYVDSVGCISCKLKLPEWNAFIQTVDSVASSPYAYLFVFGTPKEKDVYRTIRMSHFRHPVCMDPGDSLNSLNGFPTDMSLQTFLLDKDNKVLAIGSPVLNPKVKELYLRIIRGKPLNVDETEKAVQTTVSIPSTEISMGDFPWQEEQTAVFTLKNTGDKPLVIQDAVTSCGCLHVSFTQQPVLPGDEAEVHATYKADNPGYFNKNITVYTHAGNAPMKLRVRGNAMK